MDYPNLNEKEISLLKIILCESLIDKILSLPTINIHGLDEMVIQNFVDNEQDKAVTPLHKIDTEEYKRFKK